VAAIVAELNDRLVGRVLALSEAAVAGRRGVGPPGPYAWLLFGSEGRREQTLRTDQDNGLVYVDEIGAEGPAWFAELAREVIDGLVAIGFPLCPGGAMASNPKWCQPVTVWEGYFRDWIERPTPAHVLAASMYFDLRPLQDDYSLAGRLRGLIRQEAPRHPHFLSAMARDVVDRRLPLTFLGRIKTERRGPHRGRVDIKGAATLQLVAAARIHGLELGLEETSTVARFRGAAATEVYDAQAIDEIVEAFDHLLQLRLAAQLDQLAAGVAPDNWIDPTRLGSRDRLLLRAAFDAVTRVQATLRDRYCTDLFG
jgi:CBS domain-containing protein